MCIRSRGGPAGARAGVAGSDVVRVVAGRRMARAREGPGRSPARARGGIHVGGVPRPRSDGGIASGRAGREGRRDHGHRAGPARGRSTPGPVRFRRRGRGRDRGGTGEAVVVRRARGAGAGVGMAADRAPAPAPRIGAIRVAPTTKAGCSRIGSWPPATSRPPGASARRPRCRWPGWMRCAPASPGRFVPRSMGTAAKG